MFVVRSSCACMHIVRHEEMIRHVLGMEMNKLSLLGVTKSLWRFIVSQKDICSTSSNASRAMGSQETLRLSFTPVSCRWLAFRFHYCVRHFSRYVRVTLVFRQQKRSGRRRPRPARQVAWANASRMSPDACLRLYPALSSCDLIRPRTNFTTIVREAWLISHLRGTETARML